MLHENPVTREQVLHNYALLTSKRHTVYFLSAMGDATIMRIAPLLNLPKSLYQLSALLDWHEEAVKEGGLGRAIFELNALTVILLNKAENENERTWRSMEEFCHFLTSRHLVITPYADMSIKDQLVILGAYVHWDAGSECHSIQDAMWIGSNYARIAPFRKELRMRGNANPETLDILLGSKSPALSSGSL